MKKAFTSLCIVLYFALLSMPVLADVAPMPEPQEPVPPKNGSPLVPILAIALVAVAAALLVRVLRHRRGKK